MSTAKKWLWKGLPYVVFAVAIFVTLLLKVNYHMDEVWSYGLANHQGDIVMDFELGVTYDPKEVLEDYLVADPEHRFDYANVWENQRNDNHPPLYYALLHTICSLFPGTFSKWYAGAINIAFALLMFVFIRRLILQLTENRTLQFVLSLAFALSAGILNVVSFLRMYLPAMCWCTILASLAVSMLESAKARAGEKEKRSSLDAWPIYMSYALVAALGALTHYYCVVFVVLLSIAVLVCLLGYRQWVYAEMAVASILAGALAAYLVFPDMVRHVFAGDRGSQSMENLQNKQDFGEWLRYFFHMMDQELFGGFLIPLLVVLLLLGGLCLFLHVKVDVVPYGVLLFPVLGYFLIIGKTTVYETDRYFFPIFTVVFLLVFCLLFSMLRALLRAMEQYSEKFRGRSARMVFAGALVLFLLVPLLGSWQKAEWEYLYRHTADYLVLAGNYGDYDLLCLYHARYQVPTFYREMLNYKSVTFLWDGKIQGIEDLPIANSDKVLVKVISEHNDGHFLKEAMDQFPQFTQYKDLFNYWFSTTTELLP